MCPLEYFNPALLSQTLSGQKWKKVIDERDIMWLCDCHIMEHPL